MNLRSTLFEFSRKPVRSWSCYGLHSSVLGFCMRSIEEPCGCDLSPCVVTRSIHVETPELMPPCALGSCSGTPLTRGTPPRHSTAQQHLVQTNDARYNLCRRRTVFLHMIVSLFSTRKSILRSVIFRPLYTVLQIARKVVVEWTHTKSK